MVKSRYKKNSGVTVKEIVFPEGVAKTSHFKSVSPAKPANRPSQPGQPVLPNSGKMFQKCCSVAPK